MSPKTSKKSLITLHLAQIPSFFRQPLKTLKNLEQLLEKHPVKRGEWLLLPEMWPALFDASQPKKEKLGNASCYHWLKRFTQSRGCYAVGSMLEMPRSHAYNTAFVLGPRGQLLERYRKIHLFPLSGEHRQFKGGHKRVVLNLPAGPLGLAICYDLRFPEHFRALVKAGARWIVVPSAWPAERREHFEALLKARAIENQCFVIGINKCGPEKGGMVFGGHSMVLDPWGNCLTKLGAGKTIRRITLDISETHRIRMRYPFLPF